MHLRFLIILVLAFSCHKAFGFEKFNLNDIDPNENIIVEDMYEPLKVTGMLYHGNYSARRRK